MDDTNLNNINLLIHNINYSNKVSLIKNSVSNIENNLRLNILQKITRPIIQQKEYTDSLLNIKKNIYIFVIT